MPRYGPKTHKALENYLKKRMAIYDPWNSWNLSVGTTASTAVTWNHWTTANNYTTVSTNNVNNAWNHWVNYGTGTSITTNPSWLAWVNPNSPPAFVNPPVYQHRELTPEEIRVQAEVEARYQAQREENQRKADERSKKEVEAKARAKALLLDHLTPAQKRQYEEKGTFRVEVGSRTFQINPGTHGNVKEIHIQDGKEIVVRSFCIPSRRPDIPEPDVHLAQKLMLEGGVDSVVDFHRIANITEYRPDVISRLDRELLGVAA